MDTVACLTLVGHRMLLVVMEELELFTSFSSWLRFQIDRLATSSGSDELMEKEATMNNAHILAYIQKYLLRSPLSIFLVDDETGGDWEAIAKGASLLETLDVQLKKQENRQQFAEFLPKVHWLLGHLEDKASGVFSDIAQAQKRSVRFGQATTISLDREVTGVDICMDAVHGSGVCGRRGFLPIPRRATNIREQDLLDGLAYTAVATKERDSESEFTVDSAATFFLSQITGH
jgi:anaphase-promoting complex subunit 4